MTSDVPVVDCCVVFWLGLASQSSSTLSSSLVKQRVWFRSQRVTGLGFASSKDSFTDAHAVVKYMYSHATEHSPNYRYVIKEVDSNSHKAR